MSARVEQGPAYDRFAQAVDGPLMVLFRVLTATPASYFSQADVDATEAQLSEVNARLERIEGALARLSTDPLEVLSGQS